MGNDAEIAYVCGVHYFSDSERSRITVKLLKKRKFDGEGNQPVVAGKLSPVVGGGE
jgi:hypothetical protein